MSTHTQSIWVLKRRESPNNEKNRKSFRRIILRRVVYVHFAGHIHNMK